MSSQEQHDGDIGLPLTYWQYYLRVVGRVAETLLQWIGEEEDEKEGKAD